MKGIVEYSKIVKEIKSQNGVDFLNEDGTIQDGVYFLYACHIGIWVARHPSHQKLGENAVINSSDMFKIKELGYRNGWFSTIEYNPTFRAIIKNNELQELWEYPMDLSYNLVGTEIKIDLGE